MWQGLANCYTKLSRHADAIKAYKRAVLSGSTDLSILVTLASLLEQEGDLKSAAQFQYQIISETTMPGTGELTPMAAKAHIWLAKMEMKKEDYEAAERHANEALKGLYVTRQKTIVDSRSWTKHALYRGKSGITLTVIHQWNCIKMTSISEIPSNSIHNCHANMLQAKLYPYRLH